VIPEDPGKVFREGRQNDVPVIAGSTANEGGVRAVTATSADAARQARAAYGADAEQYLKVYPADTDAHAEASAYAVAADRTAAGQRNWVRLETRTGKNKAYLYLFGRVPPFPPGAHFREAPVSKIGAYHAVELIYVFNHLYLKDWPWQDSDRRIADQMSSYWVNFAATGNPNGKGLPNWPAYDDNRQERMRFDVNTAAGPLENKAALDFLDAHPAAPFRGGR